MTPMIDIGPVDAIPLRGSRSVTLDGQNIAVFRTGDDRIFALVNRCPHKHGPLSEGIIHGHAVACPLHNWRISLETGEALGADKGCTPTVAVQVEAGRILLAAPIRVAA
ncbi:nitrite reductase [Croceibacterium mercuriale]|uniref:Nitrite reductase n=1 Tax=Croceibacterium mercuriale TaxID=1572751 RepID=A0A0B2BZ65_9SPHN|nr:nitrite reductase small subunit NirD [Croceibacterium mercuriale]KHL26893.1 nitrite reductase [Croceibacterium mercuriale]